MFELSLEESINAMAECLFNIRNIIKRIDAENLPEQPMEVVIEESGNRFRINSRTNERIPVFLSKPSGKEELEIFKNRIIKEEVVSSLKKSIRTQLLRLNDIFTVCL